MSDRDDEEPAGSRQTAPWAAAGGLDDARAAALVEALRRSWPATHPEPYPTPLLTVAAAAFADEPGQALPLLEALARGAMGPEVQAGALTLWPDFILRALEGVAESEAPLSRFVEVAMALTHDPQPRVRAAAAAQLLGYSSRPEVYDLVHRLAPLRLDLEAHGDLPGAGRALALLAGSAGARDRLEAALAAGEAPSLPALVEDLTQLFDRPLPQAAPTLARLFLHLPAVADQRIPARVPVAGGGQRWDLDTTVALLTLRAWLAATPAEDAAEALDFLASAPSCLVDALLGDLPAAGDSGVVLVVALALAEPLPTPTREKAIFILSALGGRQDSRGAVARGALITLSGDAAVGPAARAAIEHMETR